MRPYLAIIKDSFREALASRVLWIFTGLIPLLLLALAPIGYKLNLTGPITWGEIADGPQLVERMRRESAAAKPSPGHRIWSLLDDETRAKLDKLEKIKDDEGEERRDGGGIRPRHGSACGRASTSSSPAATYTGRKIGAMFHCPKRPGLSGP